LRNLGTLYGHGRLGGTGYLSILPVDQGIEHSAAASFAKNPAYFDPVNLSREGDLEAQEALGKIAELPWEATNQAAVHTWYHRYFGGLRDEPFGCVHDAVATWPETATCVAVRQAPDGIEVCAPHGLGDLLGGIWRVNPVRVTPAVSMARLARQRVRARWPDVKVVLPG